jgi:hypothetical protein
MEGHMGPLCESCDVLGSVWGVSYSSFNNQYDC